MVTMAQASLFDPAPQSAIAGSVSWINGLMLGQLAVVLCVLAVGFLGLLMLFGRLPVREGLRVMIGCFVLLGAPVIASGLVSGGESATKAVQPAPASVEEPYADLPPADYDPYAGASLRHE